MHVSILFRIDHMVSGIFVGISGLQGDSLKNTGHWQCQCRWHKVL